MTRYAEHHTPDQDCGHPTPTGVSTGEVDHFWCCCEDVSLCGLDISDDGPLSTGFTACPECLDAWVKQQWCGVPACQHEPAAS